MAVRPLFLFPHVSDHGLSNSRNSILITTLKELEHADDKTY